MGGSFKYSYIASNGSEEQEPLVISLLKFISSQIPKKQTYCKLNLQINYYNIVVLELGE